jgi:hypothetical protein
MSRARTWRSNTASPTIKWIDTGAGGRAGPPARRRDRGPRGSRSSVGGQRRHRNHPDRLYDRRRPGQARSRRQPRPAGRQRDRYQFLGDRVGSEAAGAAAGASAASHSHCRAGQSSRGDEYRSHVEGREDGGPCHGA